LSATTAAPTQAREERTLWRWRAARGAAGVCRRGAGAAPPAGAAAREERLGAPARHPARAGAGRARFTALSYCCCPLTKYCAALPAAGDSYSRILSPRSSPTPSGTRSGSPPSPSGDPLPAVRDRRHYRHRRGDHLRILQSVARNRAGDGRGPVAVLRARARRQGAAPASPLVVLVGTLLLAAVSAYALWACLARARSRSAAGPARPGSGDRPHADRALGHGLSLSSAVLWWLLPPQMHIGFVTFLAYTPAVIAGIVSHVPAGGRFRGVCCSPAGRARDALLGSLLAYAVCTTWCAGVRHAAVRLQGTVGAAWRIAWAQQLASLYIAPVVPQITSALTFLARALLLFSGATPALDERLTSSTIPTARGTGGVAPRRQPRGPGAAGAGARAVPPRAGGLSHSCACCSRHVRLAPEGTRFRGSGPARPGPRVLMLAAALLPTYGDSLGALHAGVGGGIAGVIVMRCGSASSRTGASATPTSCGDLRPAR